MPRIYCCQHDIRWEDPKTTTQTVRGLIAAAAPPPGSLILLPEMFATGFSMNAPSPADAAFIQSFLSELAVELGVFIQAGVAVPGAGAKGLNTSQTFGPGGHCIARYVKLHPFTYGGEANAYSAGDELITFAWQEFTVAPIVCYDLRFPEIFRTAALRGANLFTVIANWPAHREPHWLALLAARAIENQAYVAGVNRIGDDPKIAYGGRSLIIDPQGAIVADAKNAQTLIWADLDLAPLISYRRQFPALADIRPDYRRALVQLSQ